jgi:hypothetical protein
MIEEKPNNQGNGSPKRNGRKRSVSGSHSPVLNRNNNQVNENGKNNNVSRSRSRSNDRVPRRKRSGSGEKEISF